MVNRTEIVEAARKYKGTKFKKLGRSKAGMDCVGLLVMAGRDVGLTIEDMDDYDFSLKSSIFQNHIMKQSYPADKTDLKPGQIVMLRDSIYPFHSGIIGQDKRTNQLTVINANMKRRMVIEEPISMWAGKISRVREYAGITD